VDSRRLPAAKQAIRQFRRQLAQILEEGKKDAVYQLSIQLIPLTQTETKP
jgi:hypothetical protein